MVYMSLMCPRNDYSFSFALLVIYIVLSHNGHRCSPASSTKLFSLKRVEIFECKGSVHAVFYVTLYFAPNEFTVSFALHDVISVF